MLDGRKEKWASGYKSLAEFLASTLKGRVLEAGSGRGQLSLPLFSLGTFELFCIDLSVEGLKMLRSGAEGIRAIGASSCALPFREESFDFIVSNFMIDWLDETELERSFEEFFRVLKPQGEAVIMDIYTRADKPEKRISIEQAFEENNLDPSARLWKPEEVLEVAEKAGFERASLEYFDWGIKFDYEEAKLQLEMWGARKEFIESRDEILRSRGMELFDSFVLTLVKP